MYPAFAFLVKVFFNVVAADVVGINHCSVAKAIDSHLGDSGWISVDISESLFQHQEWHPVIIAFSVLFFSSLSALTGSVGDGATLFPLSRAMLLLCFS